jgi:hypothetical protein
MQTHGQMNGRTDRYDEANSHFSQFFERAYILYKYEVYMDISGYINKAYGSYNPDYYKKTHRREQFIWMHLFGTTAP